MSESTAKRDRNEKGAYLLSPGDSDYEEFLWKAVKHINEQSESNNHLVPVNVTKAEMLLVAGSLYTFEIELAESGEAKDAVTHEQLKAATPSPKAGGKRYVYEIKIWSKPWMNFEEYTVLNSKEI
ncbi:hypothetical protein QR680_006217 [Steinernema hermaphroditum]|uniref:Cystatin domain-containing protein n=1 Tax=Steinernema hermaphroditum TaxID=289476 RepID=A0AA39LWR8_9BILA|nr:hypothetical protein QR680_006217 [Steinernema hermaphroditum]